MRGKDVGQHRDPGLNLQFIKNEKREKVPLIFKPEKNYT